MAMVDPVKIYAAKSNVQADMIRASLQAAGIEAFAGEDSSPAGIWAGGTLPSATDSSIWVSRADADRAVALIGEQERVDAERADAEGIEVEVTCEECGKAATFPSSQRGTVQECPHCGAYLDVDVDDQPDEPPDGEYDAKSE